MSSRKSPLNFTLLAGLALTCLPLVASLGCQSAKTYTACKLTARAPQFVALPPLPPSCSPAERAQQFFAIATDAQRAGDPRAPDCFYQAAILSWPYLSGGDASLPQALAWRIYHASVAGLITEGERLGRFSCPGQLQVQTPGGPIVVPLSGHGIAWAPHEIHHISVVRPSGTDTLANYHAWPGFGVSVVAIRQASNATAPVERFYARQLPFAATIILRPPSPARDATDSAANDAGALELYSPLQFNTATINGQTFPLARDISAPFDYQLQTTENTGVLGFIDPGVPEQAEGLRFVVPYQPGKIPVVFVHGLLSDPSTWFNIANDLRTQRWFNDNYQIWSFRYATGKPFVTSAMVLRRDLQQAVAVLDPGGSNPALQNMVIVGHSMGGLVAKLQVTYSGDRIWNSFSHVPIDIVSASDTVKFGLSQRCFFDPLPFVRRVVFVATPHRGSAWAARIVGRVSSSLVHPDPQAESLHEQLLEDNPGVFSPQFERRVPTSIDMLETTDPTLEAIGTLPIPPCVKLHSIIGNGKPTIAEGAGDGVVAVDSARHPGVVSQRYVGATHTSIQRHPDTVHEIECILRAHLAEMSTIVSD